MTNLDSNTYPFHISQDCRSSISDEKIDEFYFLLTYPNCLANKTSEEIYSQLVQLCKMNNLKYFTAEECSQITNRIATLAKKRIRGDWVVVNQHSRTDEVVNYPCDRDSILTSLALFLSQEDNHPIIKPELIKQIFEWRGMSHCKIVGDIIPFICTGNNVSDFQGSNLEIYYGMGNALQFDNQVNEFIQHTCQVIGCSVLECNKQMKVTEKVMQNVSCIVELNSKTDPDTVFTFLDKKCYTEKCMQNTQITVTIPYINRKIVWIHKTFSKDYSVHDRTINCTRGYLERGKSSQILQFHLHSTALLALVEKTIRLVPDQLASFNQCALNDIFNWLSRGYHIGIPKINCNSIELMRFCYWLFTNGYLLHRRKIRFLDQIIVPEGASGNDIIELAFQFGIDEHPQLRKCERIITFVKLIRALRGIDYRIGTNDAISKSFLEVATRHLTIFTKAGMNKEIECLAEIGYPPTRCDKLVKSAIFCNYTLATLLQHDFCKAPDSDEWKSIYKNYTNSCTVSEWKDNALEMNQIYSLAPELFPHKLCRKMDLPSNLLMSVLNSMDDIPSINWLFNTPRSIDNYMICIITFPNQAEILYQEIRQFLKNRKGKVSWVNKKRKKPQYLVSLYRNKKLLLLLIAQSGVSQDFIDAISSLLKDTWENELTAPTKAWIMGSLPDNINYPPVSNTTVSNLRLIRAKSARNTNH